MPAPSRSRVSPATTLPAARRRAAWLGLALLCTAAVAPAAPAAEPAVAVRDAWIRLLPAGLPAGGYMVLENRSAQTVSLVGADSPQHYGSVKLHLSQSNQGVMSMSEVERVDIPAHSSVQFKPGGYHIMLFNAKGSLKAGQSVPVILRFADGSRVTAGFQLRKSNAVGEDKAAAGAEGGTR